MARQSFHEGLKQLNHEILRMARLVVAAVDLSTPAHPPCPRKVANRVIAGAGRTN